MACWAPTLPETRANGTFVDRAQGDIYTALLNKYPTRLQEFDLEHKKVFNLLFTQVTPELRHQLEKDDRWPTIRETHDIVECYKLITNRASIDPSKFTSCNSIFSDLDLIREFSEVRQTKDETLSDFLKRYKEAYDILKAANITPFYNNFLKHSNDFMSTFPDPAPAEFAEGDTNADKDRKRKEVNAIKQKANENRVKATTENFMALDFMFRVDKKRYEAALTSLKERDRNGHDEYPKTLEAMYSRLINGVDEQAPKPSPASKEPADKKVLLTKGQGANKKGQQPSQKAQGNKRPRDSSTDEKGDKWCAICNRKVNHETSDCYTAKRVDKYRESLITKD